MLPGDKSLEIIGVQHIATKNGVTVRARIFLSAPNGALFCFDADTVTFELEQIDNRDCNAADDVRGVSGVAV